MKPTIGCVGNQPKPTMINYLERQRATIARVSQMTIKTNAMTNPNANGIHSGAKTQTQDQLITPQSLSVIKTIVSSPKNPIPLVDVDVVHNCVFDTIYYWGELVLFISCFALNKFCCILFIFFD